MSAKRRSVAYVRVSSRAQDYPTQSHSIERAAEARGEDISEWYGEKRSGKKLARPELDRLRADVRAGRVGTVYVFKLDRFTRSGVADTFTTITELRVAGCTLVAPGDNLLIKPDADDIASEVLIFALALGAKIERQSINERIAAARERLAAEGRPWGRRPRLDARDIERVAAMHAEGRSVRAIAIAMRVPRSTVGRALAASHKDALQTALESPKVHGHEQGEAE